MSIEFTTFEMVFLEKQCKRE